MQGTIPLVWEFTDFYREAGIHPILDLVASGLVCYTKDVVGKAVHREGRGTNAPQLIEVTGSRNKFFSLLLREDPYAGPDRCLLQALLIVSGPSLFADDSVRRADHVAR